PIIGGSLPSTTRTTENHPRANVEEEMPAPMEVEEDEITPAPAPSAESELQQVPTFAIHSEEQQSLQELDSTVMLFAGRPDRGLYRVYYAWDSDAAQAWIDPATRANIPEFETLSTVGTRRCRRCAFMDVSYVTGCGPSFLRLEGTAALALPAHRQSSTRYSFLWGAGPPSVDPAHYTRANLRAFIQDINVKHMVRRLYEVIQPKPDVVRERYRAMLTTEQMQPQEENTVDVSSQAANEGVIVRGYESTRTATGSGDNVGAGPMSEDAPGAGPSMMRTFVVDPGGLYLVEAQVPQLTEGTVTEEHAAITGDTEQAGAAVNSNSNPRVRYKLLKPSSMLAERVTVSEAV
ncbi:unnamed protein product, partial [Agarophyton chilense]